MAEDLYAYLDVAKLPSIPEDVVHETAFKEFKTQQRIYDFLTVNLKVPEACIQKCAGTGLIVDLKGKGGSPQGEDYCIALRADIDALPMSENNPHLDYKSVTDAAHMCGHDGHTTCLLGGIAKISENL